MSLFISKRDVRDIVRAELQSIKTQLDQIMAKVSELPALIEPIVTQLNDVGTQLDKAKTEIIKAITDNDPEVPQAVLDKVNALGGIATALKSASQALDDLNPDAPAP